VRSRPWCAGAAIEACQDTRPGSKLATDRARIIAYRGRNIGVVAVAAATLPAVSLATRPSGAPCPEDAERRARAVDHHALSEFIARATVLSRANEAAHRETAPGWGRRWLAAGPGGERAEETSGVALQPSRAVERLPFRCSIELRKDSSRHRATPEGGG
jgi:hypothetical protein